MWSGLNPFGDIDDLGEYRKVIEEVTLKGGPVFPIKYLPYGVPDIIVKIITDLIQSDYRHRSIVDDALDELKRSELHSLIFPSVLSSEKLIIDSDTGLMVGQKYRTPSPEPVRVPRTPSLPKGLITPSPVKASPAMSALPFLPATSDSSKSFKVLGLFNLPFPDFHRILVGLENDGVDILNMNRKEGTRRALVRLSWEYRGKLLYVTFINSEIRYWKKYHRGVDLIIVGARPSDQIDDILDIIEKRGAPICFVDPKASVMKESIEECISDHS